MARIVRGRQGLAVVTGASAGIGAEFARQLAERGFSVLLIARRKERLDALAAELEGAHGIAAHVLALDLADPNVAERVRTEVERISLPLVWLVNNAGYGLLGRFDQYSLDDYRTYVRVMTMAPLELIHALLPKLREAAPAHVVNVASLAGYMPGQAGANLYPGVKSLLIKLTEGLAAEFRRLQFGVTVTVTSPGMTESEIFEHAPGSVDVDRFKKLKMMTSQSVVQQALEAAEAGEVSVIPGAHNRRAALLFKLLPARLARRAVRSTEEMILGGG